MTDFTKPETSTTAAGERQIRFWGSAARLVVGCGMIGAAALGDTSVLDVVLGLAVLPLVEILLLWSRGPKAAPLRLFGYSGHALNWGIGILAFIVVPQAALLFYGASILLAFARGYAGCEIFAISNWVRRRDDQIVCPLFSPIDHAEARRAGSAPTC